MRTLAYVVGIAVLAALGWFAWNFAGLDEKYREYTIEDRARAAIDGLRGRVAENRNKTREFKIQAEMQNIKLERMKEDHARYDKAATALGEAGKQAETVGAEEPVAYRGQQISLSEARRLTVSWGLKAQSLERQISSRIAIRERYLGAIDTLVTTNSTLTLKISDLDLKLEEMLVQKEEAEVLKTLSEVNRAITTGEGSGSMAVFGELQEKIDEATATARVLDTELEITPGDSPTPLENEVLDRYWR